MNNIRLSDGFAENVRQPLLFYFEVLELFFLNKSLSMESVSRVNNGAMSIVTAIEVTEKIRLLLSSPKCLRTIIGRRCSM